MTVALDTNILVYAEGINGVVEENRASTLLSALPAPLVRLPVPVMGELYNVLSKRSGRTREWARSAVLSWQVTYLPAPLTVQAMNSGIELAARHQIQIWDAAILAVAAEAGCSLLLSEDLQYGFSWGGVTVVNPFTHPAHPLLNELFG